MQRTVNFVEKGKFYCTCTHYFIIHTSGYVFLKILVNIKNAKTAIYCMQRSKKYLIFIVHHDEPCLFLFDSIFFKIFVTIRNSKEYIVTKANEVFIFFLMMF